jgi:hypothetical protein
MCRPQLGFERGHRFQREAEKPKPRIQVIRTDGAETETGKDKIPRTLRSRNRQRQ